MQKTKTIELVRELAAMHRPAWGAKLAALRAAGIPTNDADLKAKLALVDDDLRGLREDAGQKWNALQQAQKKVGSSDGTPTEDTVAELHEAGKTYGETADRLAGAERTKQVIIDALIASGDAPAGAKASGSEHEERLQERGRAARSAGQLITEGDAFKALAADPILRSTGTPMGVRQLGEAWDREQTKALLTGGSDTSMGAFVQPDRVGYFPLPLRPLTILDLITLGDTNGDLVEYVKQTSISNAAAEVAEASAVSGTSGAKPMSDFDFKIEQTGVKTIAHWIAATRRALADAGQTRTLIDGVLRWGLDARVEAQVLNGDGAGENLLGILNITGANAVPAGAQSNADKAMHALTELRLDFFEANAIGFNPLDWETIRLERENTDPTQRGGYLMGGPSQMGAETLWGKPVVQTAAIPQGTAIVADWRAFILWMREGTQVLASDSHADFFTRNLVAVLAELRAAGGVPYPQAFCEVNLAAA